MKRLTLTALLAIAALGNVTAAQHLPLRHLSDLVLPGNPTRLDYQSLDAARRLLFVAHLGDSEVAVVDTEALRVVARIPASQVHGVLVVPELGRAYASATGSNEIVAIDEADLKTVTRVPAGFYPDGMAYDPNTRRLFVSDEHGRTETVIDTRSNRRIATLALGGEAGNSQYDAGSRRIFVNVQTLGQLIEIDPRRNATVQRIRVSGTGCSGNHGLLIDSERRRAFVACEDNGKFLWIDLRTARIAKTWTIAENPDVLALDTKTHRLFVASESGTVSVFNDGDRVTRLAQSFLAPAAHSVAVDPQTQRVYFPLENVSGRPVLRVFAETP